MYLMDACRIHFETALGDLQALFGEKAGDISAIITSTPPRTAKGVERLLKSHQIYSVQKVRFLLEFIMAHWALGDAVYGFSKAHEIITESKTMTEIYERIYSKRPHPTATRAVDLAPKPL